MKLKYLIPVLLLALLASMFTFMAVADTADEPAETSADDIAILSGAITALESDRLTIFSDNMEYVALLTENTVYEGKELLEVGDRVTIIYNGMLTRSLPAQLTADVIRCHEMTGVVSDLNPEIGQFLLTLPDESQFVVVYDTGISYGILQDGMTVTVFYDGSSTRSLPPQITAEFIRMPGVTGTVSDVTDAQFMLTEENGNQTIVHISKQTFSFVELADGMQVHVTNDGTATLSLPAQVNAVEILPAE